MNRLWGLAYNLIFFPAVILAYILTAFNRKVRRGLRGRRKTIHRARHFRDRIIDSYGPLYWFHAASHGEFEQARPIIEGLKEISPDTIIVVSFFSPSGYERCHHPDIDFKFYLPLDFPWAMNQLLRILKPHRVIFASYDIWPNLIWACRRRGIPTVLFAARVVPGSTKQWPLLKGFYRNIYRSMHAIYTVSEGDGERLQAILGSDSGTRVKILGNPRYDRVMERRKNNSSNGQNRDRTLVLGSVHAADENVIAAPVIELLQGDGRFRVLWAPHDPEPEIVASLGQRLGVAGIAWAPYSSNRGHFKGSQVLIVDGVGYLAELYYRGAVAYVGGGFGSNVHNVMEPAMAGIPVLFGPRYNRSDEAEQLVAAGGGTVVANSAAFSDRLAHFFSDLDSRRASGAAALQVIADNLGASTRILQAIIGD